MSYLLPGAVLAGVFVGRLFVPESWLGSLQQTTLGALYLLLIGIGINLFSPFLVDPSENRRATLTDVLRHIHHIEQLTGRRDCIALGSDMDGGFSQNDLPTDLNSPTQLTRLAEALSADGWTDEELNRFRWENWARLVDS